MQKELKLNLSEEGVVTDYKDRGWEVIRCGSTGFPDFYFYNKATNESEFVEVKCNQ